MKSLKLKLMLTFIILIVVSFSLLSILLYNYAKTIISNYVENSALEKMHEYASYVEMLQNQVYDSATLVYNSDITKNWLSTITDDDLSAGDHMLANIEYSQYLTQVTNSYTPIANVSVYHYPSLAISNEIYINRATTIADESWYVNLLNEKQYWSPTTTDRVEQSRGNNELMLSMVMPINSYKPELASTYLKINISQSYFFQPLERLHLGETGQFYLLDRDGNMLLTEQGNTLLPAQERYFEDVMSSPTKEGKLYKTNEHGQSDMIVFYKLPKTKWIIVGIASEKELFSELSQFRQMVLLLASILLVIAIVTALFFTHSIAKPLSSLVSAMRHLRRGDFNQAEHRMKDEQSSTLEIAFVIDMFKDMTLQLKQHIANHYQLTLLKQKAEYRALVMQINPHFLFNTLEMMSSLALQNRGQETARIIASLGHMMRYSLNGNEELTLLSNEIKFIQHYLDIIRVRYGVNQHITLLTLGNIEQVSIVKFILQPIVENAVKFSSIKQHHVQIEIEIVLHHDKLQISVHDNGFGFTDDAIMTVKKHINNQPSRSIEQQTGEQIGLKNVLLRCYSIYGEQFTYTISRSTLGGASVILHVPIGEVTTDD